MSSAESAPGESRSRLAARREALAWILVLGLLYLLYLVIEPFLSPLIWAAVLAVFFFPAHRRLRDRVRSPSLSALLSVIAVALLLVVPVVMLTPAFVGQTAQVISDLPLGEIVDRVERGLEFLSARLPPSVGNIDKTLEEGVSAASKKVGGWSAKVVGNFALFILDFVVLLLALYYLFRDGPHLVELLRDVSPFGGERHDVMMKQAMDMITVTISSSFVVAAVQGALGGMAFAVLSLPSPVFWGVVTALMAFLPFVGAWMIWMPAGVALLLQGQTGRGIALLVMGAVLVSLVDNILRPILIADRSRLNGLLVFISVLGGIQTFGLLGIVLGPLIMATAVGLLKGYQESLAEDSSGGSTNASVV